MSQHSQRTQQGPSGGQVVAGAVAIALSAAGCVYVVSGPGMDPRKAVAVILGGVLTGVLTVHVMGLVAERAVIADRVERAADRFARELEIQDQVLAARERDLAARERDLIARQSEWGQNQRPEPQPRYEEPQGPRYEEPLVDEGSVIYPERSPEETRSWLRDPEEAAVYGQDPERPWNAFEPMEPHRAALDQVAMPLPPRDGYVDPGPYSSYVPVSPGRADPDATELRYEDRPTEVMPRVDATELRYEDRPTEVIERVR
jgi:hypothetical protein